MEKETKHTPGDDATEKPWRSTPNEGSIDFFAREITRLQTELSEMKAAYEKDANKLMAERDYFKNLCEEKDKVIEDYSRNLKPVNELKAEIEKHMRELSEMKKEREELVKMIEIWVDEISSDIDNASGYKKLLLTDSKSLLNRIKK